MDWQMILFSVCIVPSKVLGENLERPLISVDVIHLPYKPNYQYTRYDSAVLSVELKDQQNFTVCFAAMLEAFSDARGNLDRAIFNSILKAISIRFDFATSAKDLFFKPCKWIHTCISISFASETANIIMNGIKVMEGNVEKDTKKTHLNITLEATMLDIKVANLNLFSSVLSEDTLEDMTDIEKTECGTSGDFLSWKYASLQWILKGNAKRLHNQKAPCDRESAVEIFSEGFLSGVACMEHCHII